MANGDQAQVPVGWRMTMVVGIALVLIGRFVLGSLVLGLWMTLVGGLVALVAAVGMMIAMAAARRRVE